MRLVAKCRECGFDNPRRWRNCARCDALLGPQRMIQAEAHTGEFSPETRRLALPAALAAAADADARTQLYRVEPSDESENPRPLIGQGHAIGRLRRSIQKSFNERRATLLTLEGDQGSGKTRMLQRASEIAAKLYIDVQVMYAPCRVREDGPYAPFSRLLLERFGITPASSPSAVRSQMATVVGGALSTRDNARITEHTHLLGHVAGVPFPDSPHLDASDPAGLHRRACQSVRQFLEGDAENHPVLLLLDDMSEAEPEAWELLQQLLETPAPIAFVISGQAPLAERAAQLGTEAPMDSAQLLPLTTGELTALIRSLLPGLLELPQALVDALHHRSSGNPDQARTLLEALRDGGVFRATERGVEVDLEQLEHGDLPLTMADAIRARAATLSPLHQRLMEHAAVVGERFWDGALLALERAQSPLPDGTIPPVEVWHDADDDQRLHHALAELERDRFIVQTASADVPGHAEYAFCLGGTRALFYERLDEESRRQRHAVVARWLSMTTGLGVEGMPAIVAPHLEHAGFGTQAARSYLEAAREERERLRTRAALRYVERAFGCMGDDDLALRIDALHLDGTLLTTLGRYDEAYGAFDQILRLAWSLGARGTAGASLNRIARLYRQRGEHRRALQHLEAALALFQSARDERGVASTYDDMAQVHRLRGHLEQALMAAKEALDIRVATEDLRGQAVSLNTIGYIELDQGRFDSAQARFTTALSIRGSIGDHEGAVQTKIALGRLAFHRGRFDEALSIYREALEGAREMDNHRFQSYLLSHIAETHLAADALDEAEAALSEAHGLAHEMRDLRILSDIERTFGLIALRRGAEDAAARLSSALQLAMEYGSREAIAAAHRGIARLRARTLFDTTGKAESAESSYRESVRVFASCGNRHEMARTQAELGYHLVERGDRSAARALLSEAAESLQSMGLPQASDVLATLEGL